MTSFFKKLFKKEENSSLAVTKEGEPAKEDLIVAIAMVLLELSGKDDDYAPEEVGTVLRALMSEFHQEKDAVLNLLDVADRQRKDKALFNEMVRYLSDSYNDSQKVTIISLLWKVLIADGRIEKSETRYVEQMRNRLRLSEAQIEEGRLQALRSDRS